MDVVSPEAVGFSAERLSRLDKAMQRYVDEGKIAGIVTLLARRGKIFHSGCYGLADREHNHPMQTKTIFRLWSVTKAITTVALLTLYEEGHFVLDSDIANFIPSFRETKVFAGMNGDQPKLVNMDRPITVRQLLTHTTGMASGFGQIISLPEQQMVKAFPPMPQGGLTPLSVIVDAMARVPLAAQPNTTWLYGPSFEVAARLVEIFSGKSFDKFLRERLFEPLGMVDTGYPVTKVQLDRFSAFYARGDNDGEFKLVEAPESSINYVPDGILPENLWTPGGAGLVSTPDDLMRFARMLTNRGQLEGARILAPATVDLMTTNHLPPHLLPYLFMGGLPYYGYGHGLGVHTLMDRGVAGVPCANGEYWKDGGSGTLFWVDPHHELTGVVMYQFDPFWLYPVWTQTKALVYQAMMEA